MQHNLLASSKMCPSNFVGEFAQMSDIHFYSGVVHCVTWHQEEILMVMYGNANAKGVNVSQVFVRIVFEGSHLTLSHFK